MVRGHVSQWLTPLSVECHVGEHRNQVVGVDMSHFLILIAQEAVILLAHIIVGDSKDELATEHAFNGQLTVIEQQAWEDLWVGDVMRWESGEKLCSNLAFLGDGAYHALAITIHLVELQQLLHLVIISSGIGVYHLLWRPSIAYVVAQVIDYHVTVEHLALSKECILGKQ